MSAHQRAVSRRNHTKGSRYATWREDPEVPKSHDKSPFLLTTYVPTKNGLQPETRLVLPLQDFRLQHPVPLLNDLGLDAPKRFPRPGGPIRVAAGDGQVLNVDHIVPRMALLEYSAIRDVKTSLSPAHHGIVVAGGTGLSRLPPAIARSWTLTLPSALMSALP
jgi:hypothetical protein